MDAEPATSTSADGVDIAEMSMRSSYHLNESLVPCSPQLLISVMKCIICDEQLDSTVFGCCKEHGHPICKPCYYGCLTALSKKSMRCPFLFEDKQKMCGAKILSLNFKDGIPSYWQNYLDKVNLQSPCPTSKYGCEFVGQSEIGLMTHSLSCKFMYLRECKFHKKDMKACGASFDSVAELMQHLSLNHNFMVGKKCKQIIRIPFNYTPATALTRTEENWSPLVRFPTPYAEGKYCLIFVDENATSVRILVTDVDPTVDFTEDIPYSMKAPVLADFSYPSFTYGLTGKILPYMTADIKDVETDIPYFEIPKKFILPYAQHDEKSGTTFFRIFITFDLSV